MIRNFRYDLIEADLGCGVKTHPQEDMINLGFTLIKSEPVPIGDCWWFRTEGGPENPPPYLARLSDSFTFSDEQFVYNPDDPSSRCTREIEYRLKYPAIWKQDGSLTDAGKYRKESGCWKNEYDEEREKYTVGYYLEERSGEK